MQSPWELSSEPCEEARECVWEVQIQTQVVLVTHALSTCWDLADTHVPPESLSPGSQAEMSVWVGGVLLLSFNVCLFICVRMWVRSPIPQCLCAQQKTNQKGVGFLLHCLGSRDHLRLGGKGLYPPSHPASLLWFFLTPYQLYSALSYCSIGNNSEGILSHHESSAGRIQKLSSRFETPHAD